MKKSSIEWFFMWLNDNYEASNKEINEAFEKAKEMHEQEVTDAYEACLVTMMTSKQYYNETFKSE